MTSITIVSFIDYHIGKNPALGLGCGLAVVFILLARRINPAMLLLLGGVAGYFLLRA